MIDWNGNHRLDCVDIGIDIAAQSAETETGIELGGYWFRFIQELEPKRTLGGKIKVFDPKADYLWKAGKKLNKYGNGPFCRFSIKNGYFGRRGVYAMADDDELLYIGQTVNLEQRFNQGYGNIQPVNCYAGGQSTNCKINSMVLEKYLSGKHVYLFFCECKNYDAVEHELIDSFAPPYNSQQASSYEHERRKNMTDNSKTSENNNNDFEKIWNKIISLQGEEFRTERGIRFTYKVVGNNLYPLHIRFGHGTKAGVEKAFRLGRIVSPSQLSSEGIMAPSYVYAILTDKRLRA